MPSLNISQMQLRLDGADVHVVVDFSVSQSDTEKRLQIPALIWFQLKELDDKKDQPYLSANWKNEYMMFRPDDPDERASSWHRAQNRGNNTDLFENGTYRDEFTVPRSRLPSDDPWNAEDWYVFGECRSDIRDDIALSNSQRLDI